MPLSYNHKILSCCARVSSSHLIWISHFCQHHIVKRLIRADTSNSEPSEHLKTQGVKRTVVIRSNTNANDKKIATAAFYSRLILIHSVHLQTIFQVNICNSYNNKKINSKNSFSQSKHNREKPQSWRKNEIILALVFTAEVFPLGFSRDSLELVPGFLPSLQHLGSPFFLVFLSEMISFRAQQGQLFAPPWNRVVWVFVWLMQPVVWVFVLLVLPVVWIFVWLMQPVVWVFI